MPGLTIDWGHWKAGGIWVQRPDFYFDDSRPEWLWLELTPSPELMRAFGADLDALIHHMRRLSEDGIRAIRDARTRPPMGAQKVQRLHPWAEPKTLAEPGGRRVPSFKIGARGFLGRRLACKAATETSEWRKQHEGCRLTRLAGRPAVFPHGTYGMRVFHGVDVAEPLPDAIVAKPGPLLHEVIEEIEEAREGGAPLPDDRVAVLDEVRAAWRDEASEVVGADELDFAKAAAPAASAPAQAEQRTSADGHDSTTASSDPKAERERPEPEARHRFHCDQDHGGTRPRRLIVHRDRRRGRPRKKRGRSDPPS
jgi:hypothetical protein